VCVVGSHGNATDAAVGCQPCRCNGHENLSAGVCDRDSGTCFCLDHTEGDGCERCSDGFYGDPKNGGHCYYDCSARSIISHERSGHLGVHAGRVDSKRPISGGDEGSVSARKCLWIISPRNVSLEKGPPAVTPRQTILQLRIERSAEFSCVNSHVHVYDGLPRSAQSFSCFLLFFTCIFSGVVLN
jgi:hypothetical protein